MVLKSLLHQLTEVTREAERLHEAVNDQLKAISTKAWSQGTAVGVPIF